MLTMAAVLFAVAALDGITLATLHLRQKGLPMALAIGRRRRVLQFAHATG